MQQQLSKAGLIDINGKPLIGGDIEGPKSKDDMIYDFDEDELWSDYEETHALDEIDPETGRTVGEPFLYI